MNILFTTSVYPASKLITSVLKEPVSHCAVHFPESDLVHHMSFFGYKVTKLAEFLEKNTVHFGIQHSIGGDNYEAFEEYKLYNKYEHKHYDYLAFLAIGIKFLLNKLCIKTPKINLLNLSGAMICTEFVSDAIGITDKTMITPYQLYLAIKSKEV